MDRDQDLERLLLSRAKMPDAPEHLSAQILSRAKGLNQIGKENTGVRWAHVLQALDEFFILPQPILTLGAIFVFAISMGIYYGDQVVLADEVDEYNIVDLEMYDTVLTAEYLLGEL